MVHLIPTKSFYYWERKYNMLIILMTLILLHYSLRTHRTQYRLRCHNRCHPRFRFHYQLLKNNIKNFSGSITTFRTVWLIIEAHQTIEIHIFHRFLTIRSFLLFKNLEFLDKHSDYCVMAIKDWLKGVSPWLVFGIMKQNWDRLSRHRFSAVFLCPIGCCLLRLLIWKIKWCQLIKISQHTD